MCARLDQTLGGQIFFRARITGQQRHSVSQYLLDDRPADLHSLIFPAGAIEREDPTSFKHAIVGKQYCSALCGDNFKEKFEQSFQKTVEATDRVNHRAYFHERAQIASHLIERVVETNLHGGTAYDLSFVESDVARFRGRLTFVCQKNKVRVADANSIAMLKLSIFNRHVVNEC